MPATDILNPSATNELNPDYGWTKRRAGANAHVKPRGGAPYRRELGDYGIAYNLNFGTTIDCQKLWVDIARLRRYQEQYAFDGYFTIIDWDSATHRQHVGFMPDPINEVEVGNNRYAAQGVTFIEVPGAAMVEYPSDWTNDAIWKYCVGDPINGQSFIQPAVDDFANWTLTVDGLSLSGSDLQGNITDAFVRFAYVGWGFQFWAPKGPALGEAQIFLDGVSQGTVDLYAAAGTASASLLTVTDVPLGQHTVKMVCTGSKNGASSGYTVIWDALQVMR
jgi:hypothetical protein